MNPAQFHDHVNAPTAHWALNIYKGNVQVPEAFLKRIEGENLVVTLGKQILLDRLFGINGPPAAILDMGVGDDATTAVVGNTKLNNPGSGNAFFQGFDSVATRSGQVVTATSTFSTTNANFVWGELGLANSTTNDGTHLFNRIAPIGPFTKTSAVSIVVTVTITQS